MKRINFKVIASLIDEPLTSKDDVINIKPN